MVTIFQRWNCTISRTTGDHVIMTRPDLQRPLVIPKKSNLHEDVLHSNLRTLRRSKEEFLRELKDT